MAFLKQILVVVILVPLSGVVVFYPVRIPEYQWFVDSAFDVAHIPFVAVLYVKIYKALIRRVQSAARRMFVSSAITALIIVIVEGLQMGTGRTADIHDVAQGFLGILAGSVFLEATTQSSRVHTVAIVLAVAALQFADSARSNL